MESGIIIPSAANEQAILGNIDMQQEHVGIYECACDCECGGHCHLIKVI